MLIFWVVTPSELADRFNVSEEYTASILRVRPTSTPVQKCLK
jgi:hypothetical protein